MMKKQFWLSGLLYIYFEVINFHCKTWYRKMRQLLDITNCDFHLSLKPQIAIYN
jgi:hypothetical protein